MSRLNDMQTALRAREAATPRTERAGDAGPGGASSIARVMRPLRRAWRARRTERALGRLSDRELRDIGVERGDIPALATRLAAEAREAPAAPRRPGPIAALRRGWARRGMIRELQALPDDILRDVGIPRHEIEPMVDRALARQEGRDAAPPRDFWEGVEGAVGRARQWQWTRTPAGEAAAVEPAPQAPARPGRERGTRAA